VLRQTIYKLIIASFAICFFGFNSMAKTSVEEIKFISNSKIELSLSQKTSFTSFILKNPDRLVVDIFESKLAQNSKKLSLPYYIKDFRYSTDSKKVRVVFDLNGSLKIIKSHYEKIARDKYGKIIIDVDPTLKISSQKKENDEKVSKFIFTKVEEFNYPDKKEEKVKKGPRFELSHGSEARTPRKIISKSSKSKKPIIVIDAGHGGKDPGAIGRYLRTKEKNITLSYSKELAKQLNKTKKYKVYLTRAGDSFIPLRGRVNIARRKNADMFISIHANSAKNRSVSGFSIYTLSEKSSDKQAERLARKENRSDIIHGVNFTGASADIMKTLIDLSQRESMNSSAIFANEVIRTLKKSGDIKVLQHSHRFAGFAVLTAPDMASVLIELGYLSNKKEEKLLNSWRYRKQMSSQLVKAINNYFSKVK